jgi:hypothetical protein
MAREPQIESRSMPAAMCVQAEASIGPASRTGPGLIVPAIAEATAVGSIVPESIGPALTVPASIVPI